MRWTWPSSIPTCGAPTVSWVPQRPHLFAQTIVENVRLSRPEASDGDVRPAIARVGLSPAVERLPQGLATVLGTGGAGLSTGERQRVALARAFLRDAPVLLLDEPTANLDGQTEEAVLTSVRTLMVGRTVIVAAHRPSLLNWPTGSSRSNQWGRCSRERTGRHEGRAGARRPHAGRRPAQRPAGGAGLPARGRRHCGRHRADGLRRLAHLAGGPTSERAVLALAIVGVQFFGLSRAFLRYEERLVGHDAAFRVLAAWRVRVYRRLERVARRAARLPARRPLAGMVRDVDSLQDVILRVIPPFSIALMVGVGTVAVMWWSSRPPAWSWLLALLLAATVVPWLTGVLATAGIEVLPRAGRARRVGGRSHRGCARTGGLRCRRGPTRNRAGTRRRPGLHRHRLRRRPASGWPSPPCCRAWPAGAV